MRKGGGGGGREGGTGTKRIAKVRIVRIGLFGALEKRKFSVQWKGEEKKKPVKIE